MITESDRWFYIEQDRKRELTTRQRRSKKRVAQSAQRERQKQYIGQNIHMESTNWEYDELGNMSRKIYSK